MPTSKAALPLAAAGNLDDKALTINAFGCLLGEIIVRNDAGVWVEIAADVVHDFGAGVGVQLPNERLINPIGAAFKRAHLGPERSVVGFRLAVLAASPGVEPRTPAP